MVIGAATLTLFKARPICRRSEDNDLQNWVLAVEYKTPEKRTAGTHPSCALQTHIYPRVLGTFIWRNDVPVPPGGRQKEREERERG